MCIMSAYVSTTLIYNVHDWHEFWREMQDTKEYEMQAAEKCDVLFDSHTQNVTNKSNN